ncbi:amidohydrolase [Gephyromycinifex aptenodytis]|uniref:amidohydrolase n=1 Tax=Gephyromycinifex aptenodytis TaxID=2716227 RepID=UPI001D02605B|nr:amidohydrolase [Gephyromycinifex aptenodytis]
MNVDTILSGLSAAVDGLDEELRAFRRDLHRYPELSWQEARTTFAVRSRLEYAGCRVQQMQPTGVIVDLGPEKPELRVGLRADMDALPLVERTGLEFASTRRGVTHACGHDVHTTALLGAVLALKTQEEELHAAGIGVRAIFQPAEETMPGGGEHVVADGHLDGVDIVFAVHCDPSRDVGEIGLRRGPITAASDKVTVRLTGTGGHTSRPYLTQDLIFALGKVITDVPGVLSRRIDPRVGALLVWGGVHAGGAANIIPDSGEVTGTLRMLDAEAWKSIRPLLIELVEAVVMPYGVQAEVRHVRGVPPVVNSEWAVAAWRDAAGAMLGAGSARGAEQSLGGEDFAWMLQGRDGALARLGTRTPGGPSYDLHQGDLVVDERSIAVGARMYAAAPFAAWRNRRGAKA